MNYAEYYEKCPVTLKDLGTGEVTGFERNTTHMLFGLSGEVGEILSAIEKGDKVELREELGDSAWFHTCYQHISNSNLKRREKAHPIFELNYGVERTLGTYSRVEDVKDLLLKTYYRLTKSGKSILKNPYYFMKQFSEYQKYVSSLIDLDKKEFIYMKPQDHLTREYLLSKIAVTLSRLIEHAGFSKDEVFEKNIQKLHKGRYKSGSYSDKEATERNLDEERKGLI